MNVTTTLIQELFQHAEKLATIQEDYFRKGEGCIEKIAIARFLKLAQSYDLAALFYDMQLPDHPEIVYQIKVELTHYVENDYLVFTFIVSLMCTSHIVFRELRSPVAMSKNNVVFKIKGEEQATEKQIEGLVQLITSPDMFCLQRIPR